MWTCVLETATASSSSPWIGNAVTAIGVLASAAVTRWFDQRASRQQADSDDARQMSLVRRESRIRRADKCIEYAEELGSYLWHLEDALCHGDAQHIRERNDAARKDGKSPWEGIEPLLDGLMDRGNRGRHALGDEVVEALREMQSKSRKVLRLSLSTRPDALSADNQKRAELIMAAEEDWRANLATARTLISKACFPPD